MLAGSYIRGTICKYENRTLKVARNAREVWNPVCSHGNKTFKLVLCSTLVEPCYKESNISVTNWLRYLFSSYLIKIWLSIRRHHLANLHILKTRISLERKEIFKKVNCIFLLIQTTCLCFNTTGNMRFSS